MIKKAHPIIYVATPCKKRVERERTSVAEHTNERTLQKTMRTFDAQGMKLVHRGKEWILDEDPSSKKMVKHLLRNENLVTWLQPFGKGPEDQIPAIRVSGDRFCALSVRMMKAIWRCACYTHEYCVHVYIYRYIRVLLLLLDTPPCRQAGTCDSARGS